MENKKSQEADLEKKKIGFFSVGLVIASASIWLSMSFVGVQDDTAYQKAEEDSMAEELVYEITPEDEPPPEEPEIAPPPPPQTEDIVEVEDDIEVETDFSNLEVEIEEVPTFVPVEIEKEEIYDFVDVDPEFQGGEAAMAKWIQENVEYPQMSIEMGETGTVYVEFVVNKNGSIEQVRVVRGVSDALDAEAKRVVKKMPKWKPGEQAGKPVRVRYTIPINFRLG